jgi:hypothetical protein
LLVGVALAVALLATLIGAGVGAGADTDKHAAKATAAASPTSVPSTGTGTSASTTSTPPTAAPATLVSVTLEPGHEGRPIPPDYLGLSFEATDLKRLAEYGQRGNLPQLLRSLGPGLLRFGGVSADTRIAWTDATTPRPSWAVASLQAADLRTLRTLAERSGWRVLLTVGLAHYDPRSAAREVAAARAGLGPWLAGIEIGNEPDAYARHGFRGPAWGFARYDAQVRAYRQAIARLTPGVPMLGPGVSGSHIFARWGPREARRERPLLLTGHHYPLGCHQQPGPTIERLLSAETRALETKSLRRYMAVSRGSGIPFRMDELNSVSCGGRAGISNTFTSALWATSYIGEALAAGVSGVNFEGNPANCLGYSPVCAATIAGLAAGRLSAQPLWYALTLTRGLAGDRPIRAAVAAPAGTNMTVTALRSPSGSLQFLLVNDEPPGTPPLAVTLHVGSAYRTAAIAPLTAPAPQATSGVRIGGAAVATDGSLAAARIARVPASNGAVPVTLEPSSAALVTAGP